MIYGNESVHITGSTGGVYTLLCFHREYYIYSIYLPPWFMIITLLINSLEYITYLHVQYMCTHTHRIQTSHIIRIYIHVLYLHLHNKMLRYGNSGAELKLLWKLLMIKNNGNNLVFQYFYFATRNDNGNDLMQK